MGERPSQRPLCASTALLGIEKKPHPNISWNWLCREQEENLILTQMKTWSFKTGWGEKPPQRLLYAPTTPLGAEGKSSSKYKKNEGREKEKATSYARDKEKMNYI